MTLFNYPARMVFSILTEVSVTITRPADTTAYTAKDAVADSTSVPTILTFPDVAFANGRGGYIVSARIYTDQVTNVAQYKLHLFNQAPTPINDNAAMTAPLMTDNQTYQGAIIWPAAASEDGSVGAAFAQLTTDVEPISPHMFQCATHSRDLYGMLETLDAFTPASGQTFRVTLGIVQS